MTIDRRGFIAATAAALASARSAFAAPAATADTVRPEDFGAKGDGRTNDSAAFEALAAHINRRGGGTVVLRKTTYLVGKQFQSPRVAGYWSFAPHLIMEFKDLARPLVIRGNGAKLVCAPGLRYGTFDPAGNVVKRPMPNLIQGEIASPYRAMIYAGGCRGTITISDIELDGNLPRLLIGGPFGDSGHQIPSMGLYLEDNHAAETVRNLHCHHHGQDGIVINGVDSKRGRSRFENVVCEYNGRQGVSIVGGRGYDFIRSKFNHTGRSAVASAPFAGLDIEAEGTKSNRDFTFTDCEFVNNVGCGMVADSGDSAEAVFTRCKFVGTTVWSAWPNKPYFRFHDCTFVGSVVHAFADNDKERSTQFHNCIFSDDPARAPGGKVYLPHGDHGPIADFGSNDGENVLFDTCTIRLTHNGQLPWTKKSIYYNCVMSQKSPRQAYPQGIYRGRNVIDANVDLYGSQYPDGGVAIVNGRKLP